VNKGLYRKNGWVRVRYGKQLQSSIPEHLYIESGYQPEIKFLMSEEEYKAKEARGGTKLVAQAPPKL